MDPKGVDKSPKENVFYGVFKRFLWRNEKNGASYFLVSTKNFLILESMYSKKETKRNRKNEDEIWFTMTCDGTKSHVPYFDSNTPVMMKGYFNTQTTGEYCWDFVISEIKEASNSESATIEYLASNSFPGINYEAAVKIVANFGADIFSFVTKNENALKQIVKLTDLPEEVVSRMVKTIQTTVAERELFELFHPLGLSYACAAKAIKFYKQNALKTLKNNPYIAGKRIGLNFKECDKLAKEFHISSMDDRRLDAAVKVATDIMSTDGHVWYEQKALYNKVNSVLQTESYQVEVPNSIIVAATSKYMTGFRYKGKACFYNINLFESEKNIINHIKRLSLNPEKLPYDDSLIAYAEKACGMHYGTQQRSAFPNLLTSKGVKILTGGPGTGKTTTVKGLIMAYKKMNPNAKIRLCAPTGRAAQRMSESTEMEAVTIHRLCEYVPFGDAFSYKDASDPIDADLIVVDEFSMATIELTEILLGAIKNGSSLWIIGDIHQLESVGPGAVLHDMLMAPDTLIARQMLTEVFRQKGGSPIIENALRINEGVTELEVCDDFQIIHTKCEEETLQAVMDLCEKLHNPLSPFDTQILCPARKGLAGINSCNEKLQDLLNPKKKGQYMLFGKTRYQIGDKIIMTNNNYDTECQYFNGDIGIVKKLEEKGLVVDIRGNDLLLERSSLEDIELAYGMTIHKSQGSEFPYVIVVMPMNPSNMLVRNLLYTAVTRAKKKVYIIDEGSAMKTAIKVDKSGSRQTTLGLMLENEKAA